MVVLELGHASEVLGGVGLPTSWLGEVFAHVALSAVVATPRPESLDTLEVPPFVGSKGRRLAAGVRAEGDRTLDELEAHDTGGDAPSSPVNDAWCPYRWLRLAARMVEREGEGVVTRSWKHVRGRGDEDAGAPAPSGPVPFEGGVPPLGRAVERWRRAAVTPSAWPTAPDGAG